ncbi:MAG: radical SAM protein [Candidatus Lokiarchaeota archaeon]|nr:radical SAM protein [Candidatus Lokiarchaeota archaeon]
MITENIIVKDWRKIDFSFGLIYPNIYKLGMSSYTIRLLYFLINSYENIACERIFLPENIRFPASKDYSSRNNIRSLENKVLPNEFDIIGFSLHFENDFKNILWILEKSDIPLTSRERLILAKDDKEPAPIIIGGGPVVTSNPLPLSKIFDMFFIGDSEPNFDLFFKIFHDFKKNKIDFKELLEKAAKISGIFVPSLNNKVERGILKDLNKSPIPIFQLISKTSNIFENNFFIEINRGCPFQCKFCISSFHNFPFRNRSYENILRVIEQGVKYSNFDTISLIGSCVSSHPKFKDICKFIISKEKRLTIPSIRVEHLTSDIIDILEKGDVKTITIAPEAGTEDLRYELGKRISNDKIYSVLAQIKESKIKNVKLYFLIGLPNEKDENINDIIDLIKNFSNIGFDTNSLRVNINPFIPKLNTPYEKEVDFYLKENSNKFSKYYHKLTQELKKIPSIKIKFINFKEIVKNARLQTLFSLGDQNISELLINYYLNGANFGSLRKVQKELNFSMNNYLIKIKDCYSPWRI